MFHREGSERLVGRCCPADGSWQDMDEGPSLSGQREEEKTPVCRGAGE